MAFTKVVGPGIHTLAQLRTHNIHSAGIITATRFVGEIGAGTGNTSTFTNVNVTGNLTVQGDTTTLNTTLRNVELLRVAANTNTTAGIITQTGTGDILNLFDGTTEVLTVTDGGSVGIGTTNPNQKLTVYGNVQVDGISSSTSSLDVDNQVNLGSNKNDEQLLLNLRGNVHNDGILRFKNIRFADGNNWETASFRIQRMVDSTQMGYIDFGSGGANAGRDIQFGNGNGTLMMHLDATGLVGIGTVGPETNLTIAQNATNQTVATIPTVRLTNLDTTAVATDIVGSYEFFSKDVHSLNKVTGFMRNIPTDAGVNYDLTFGTIKTSDANAVERLRIKSDGKVGIGTVVPSAKLETYQSGTTGYLFRAMAGLSVGNRSYDLKAPSSDSLSEPFSWNTGNSHAFQVDGVERLRIADNGKVGIGTDDPDTFLHVFSPTTNYIAKFESGDGIVQVGFFDNDTSNGNYIGASGENLRFYTDGFNDRMIIKDDGKVGIGTVVPIGFLDVRDASGSDPTVSLHHSVADVNGEVIRIGRTDLPTIRYHSINAMHGGAAVANYIKFNLHNGGSGSGYTEQREVLRIKGNGYVGINTTGSYPLDVFEPTSNAGWISISGANPSYDTGFLIRNATTPKWYLLNDVNGTGGHSFEIRGDGNNSDRFFTLTQSGKFGLHNTDPDSILLVRDPAVLGSTAGDTSELFNARTATGNSTQLRIQNVRLAGGTDWTTTATRLRRRVDVTDQAYLDFGTNYTSIGYGTAEIIRFQSDGKVGFGFTNPSQPVSIKGRVSIDVNNDYYGVWADGSTTGENHISVGRWYNTGGGLKSGYTQYGINNLILENNNPTAAHTLIIQPNGQQVAIGTHITDGLVHIGKLSAGSVSADAGGDELVLESSGNTGMSILSPGTGESTIFFGNPGTNGQKDGYIRYNHESHSTTGKRRTLSFITGGGDQERVRIGSLVEVFENANGVGVVQVGDNKIGGLYISVTDETMSNALYMPRKGCIAAITSFTSYDTYPQPNSSGFVYMDMGPSRLCRIMYTQSSTAESSDSTVGTSLVAKGPFTSTVSDCDDGKTTIMTGDIEGTFRIVNRTGNDYVYTITFL